jgi:hypothetical protein
LLKLRRAKNRELEKNTQDSIIFHLDSNQTNIWSNIHRLISLPIPSKVDQGVLKCSETSDLTRMHNLLIDLKTNPPTNITTDESSKIVWSKNPLSTMNIPSSNPDKNEDESTIFKPPKSSTAINSKNSNNREMDLLRSRSMSPPSVVAQCGPSVNPLSNRRPSVFALSASTSFEVEQGGDGGGSASVLPPRTLFKGLSSSVDDSSVIVDEIIATLEGATT